MSEPALPDFTQLAQARVPLVIAGSTASGKSQLALQIALQHEGEIINLDPFQALRGLSVLTAQPSELDLAAVPHHLYGLYSLQEELSAADFAKVAHQSREEVQARGKWPIIVTGSGLYLRAFSHGLSSSLPPTPPELVQKLASQSLADKVQQLQALDPLEASRIDLQNPRRVERALALCELLGEPVSRHRDAQLSWEKQPQHALEGIWLSWQRDQLWQRIEQRAEQMFAGDELANELWALEGKRLGASAVKVIGLQEARDWLGGRISTQKAIEKLSILTRQYAKRQRTWFAKEQWLQAFSAQELLAS